MENNLALARIILEQGFGGNPDVLNNIVPETFIEHQFGMEGTRESLKNSIRNLRQAFPDLSYTLIDSVTKQDTVWMNYQASGTHTGVFMGKPATNKKFTISVIDIMRFEAGKIVEHWGVPDRLGLVQQLGLMPG